MISNAKVTECKGLFFPYKHKWFDRDGDIPNCGLAATSAFELHSRKCTTAAGVSGVHLNFHCCKFHNAVHCSQRVFGSGVVAHSNLLRIFICILSFLSNVKCLCIYITECLNVSLYGNTYI